MRIFVLKQICSSIVIYISQGLGYSCDRLDHVVLRKTVKGLWTSGLEKPLIVKHSVRMFCRSLEDNVKNSANDRGLACEISEGRLKTYQGHCCFDCEDSVVLVSWG